MHVLLAKLTTDIQFQREATKLLNKNDIQYVTCFTVIQKRFQRLHTHTHTRRAGVRGVTHKINTEKIFGGLNCCIVAIAGVGGTGLMLNLRKRMSFSQNPTLRAYLAKALFFLSTLTYVGWTRFQNSFFIENGLSNSEIGVLKSIGLFCKFFGEPFICIIADKTSHKSVFLLCLVSNIVTMEIMRSIRPVTFNLVFLVKVLRTVASPAGTLTATVAMSLVEGSSEGYGEQRAFGSIAWGVGSFVVGALIDLAGMDSMFYYSYTLCIATILIVIWFVPSDTSRSSLDHKDGPRHASPHDKKQVALSRARPLAPLPSAEVDISRSVSRRSHAFAFDTGEPDSLRTAEEDGISELVPLVDEKPTLDVPHRDGRSSQSWLRSTCESMVAGIKLYYYALFVNGGTPIKCLLCGAFVYGIVMTVADTFLYVSLERDFGASRTANGSMTTVSILGSAPVFWYSSKLIRRFKHESILLVAQLATILRLGLLSLVTYELIHSPSEALALISGLQLLHGAMFAAYWATAVDVISCLSKRDHIFSGSLAVLNSLCFTLGAGIGNPLWGYVYDHSARGIVDVYLLAGLLLGLVVLCQRFVGYGLDALLIINSELSDTSTFK
jgi:predicted MFS family arabinose efflux permease